MGPSDGEDSAMKSSSLTANAVWALGLSDGHVSRVIHFINELARIVGPHRLASRRYRGSALFLILAYEAQNLSLSFVTMCFPSNMCQ